MVGRSGIHRAFDSVLLLLPRQMLLHTTKISRRHGNCMIIDTWIKDCMQGIVFVFLSDAKIEGFHQIIGL